MNAIELLTREELNLQYQLEQCPKYLKTLLQTDYEKAKQELTNIERALETLKTEAQKQVGLEW